VKAFLNRLLPFCVAFSLLAGVTVAQQSGGGGSGGASLNAPHTWSGMQTFSGGATATTYTFTSGSLFTEIGNGQVAVTDSTGTSFSNFLFGHQNTWPKLVSAANRIQLARQDNASGVALGFSGTTVAGSCTAGDFFIASTGLAQVCAASTVYEPFGVVAPPASVTSGTTPSVSPVNANTLSGGTASFRVNVGTGGSATQISFSLTAAPVGWNCSATNLTAMAAHVANTRVVQLSGSTTAIVLESQTISTGAAVAFAASDIVAVTCSAF
jgi:hypothetical protein